MIQNFTIYTLIYLITALVSFFVAVIAWQRRRVKGGKEITLLMIASGFGSFALIFESIAAIPSEKILWSTIEFAGGITIPVLYLLFVFRFTDREKFLSKYHIISYFIIPFITFC
ncbi:MAG: histidine kinase N-terminal 7TM domain-containing protein, partial [Bacteroidales bacterium]|nr:histidine kinase N-terminal 7TM domain-containing protein [Bacteroidales bacterium]